MCHRDQSPDELVEEEASLTRPGHAVLRPALRRCWTMSYSQALCCSRPSLDPSASR